MVHEDDYFEDQIVRLVYDITVPPGHEVVALATCKVLLEHTSILIGAVLGCQKFINYFPESGLAVAHSTLDTRGEHFRVKIANLGSEAVQLRKGAIVTTLGPVANELHAAWRTVQAGDKPAAPTGG